MKAIGWDQAVRAQALGLERHSKINLAYKVRENEHPEFGGLELEIAGFELAE